MKTTALKSQGKVLIAHCGIARDFLSRFLGLMGRETLHPDEGILFPKCNSIHTFFMRFNIDVVFLDQNGKVVGVAESYRPWRMMLPRRDTKHILELRAGRSRELGIESGVALQVEGMWA